MSYINTKGENIFSISKEAYADIIAAEEKVKNYMNNFLSQITDTIKGTTVDGVSIIETTSKNGPRCYAINTSALSNMILSVDYYCPELQADIIKQALQTTVNKGSISDFFKKIEDLLQHKSVKMKNRTYHLNPCTLNILRATYDCQK